MTDSESYPGSFEVHLTVEISSDERMHKFRQWCQDRSLKAVEIVLDRGRHTHQPMATWRRAETTLEPVLDEANAFAADAAAHFEVTRVKIEAAPDNEGVPVSDEESSSRPRENYFEHHIKLLRTPGASADALTAAVTPHGAHVSRNAFRQRDDGRAERFVTLRSYAVGREASAGQLLRLLETLDSLGEEVVEFESEYCVYDSRIELDAGWLPASE